MSNTLLETIRSKHEEIEQLEKSLAKAIQFKDNNPKERVAAEMIIKQSLEFIQKRTKELIELYEDRDGLYKEEIQILAGNKSYLDSNLNLLNNSQKTQRAPDVWFNFYEKLKEIKQINKRNILSHEINENYTADKIFNSMLDEINSKAIFTADENKGKCVDMHMLHLQFINIKGIREIQAFKKNDYLAYFNIFDKFDMIPLKIKFTNEYKTYLKGLLEYLKTFFLKVQPMVDFNDVQDIIDNKFETDWNKRDVSGWKWVSDNSVIEKEEEVNEENGNNNNKSQQEEDENNKSIHDNNQGTKGDSEVLFCKYCKKEFKKQTLYQSHLKGKKHMKKEQNVKNKENEEDENENLRELAYYEYQIWRYKDILGDVFENAKNQIRKKQAMNLEELEADVINEAEIRKIDIDDNDSKPIYNPKNVPIGWDGKPIPYWLYKVHGLGIEYKCEICGGASYWGRKAFEHHFQEWRHTFGMKCLRLPNTMQFKEVTSIEDALRLHQAIIENEKKNEFRPELEEEFEDNEGNLVNKKMYLDLKRQGLIQK